MLILFDIDGTLLRTEGAGTRSMHSAGRELYGDGFTFDGVEVAGRTDPLIWADVARVNGIGDADGHHARFRDTYRRHLARCLADEAPVRVLPGVATLIDALRPHAALTLGLLTGNYPETGRLKIEAAGLDMAWFPVTAWGDAGPTRRDLPPVAIRQAGAMGGGPIGPEDVVIIGDTPHDVDCARVNRCRALAVATGFSSRDDLVAAGADLVVDDLSGTDSLVKWIVSREPVPGE